jgi:hypothetical protein
MLLRTGARTGRQRALALALAGSADAVPAPANAAIIVTAIVAIVVDLVIVSSPPTKDRTLLPILQPQQAAASDIRFRHLESRGPT